MQLVKIISVNISARSLNKLQMMLNKTVQRGDRAAAKKSIFRKKIFFKRFEGHNKQVIIFGGIKL
jgi:hypothetical protein